MTFHLLRNGKEVEHSESLVYLANKYRFKLTEFNKSSGFISHGVKVELIDDTKKAVKLELLCRQLVLKIKNSEKSFSKVKKFIMELEKDEQNHL